MYYITNICCLCVKSSYDIFKSLRDYDEDNITFLEKLSTVPILLQGLNEHFEYKLCSTCCSVISNIHDFTKNAVRSLNIFKSYHDTCSSKQPGEMFEIFVKLEDISEKVDSCKLTNEQPSPFDIDNLTQSSSAVKVELSDNNDDKTTLESIEELHAVEQQSVKTETADIGESHSQPEFTDEEVKMEIEECDIKAECFSNEDDDSLLEASHVVQGSFICGFCKQAFTISEHCKKHTKTCRNRTYNQSSTTSDNVSVTAVLEKKPKKTRDEEVNLYQCEQCDKKFKSREGLYLHARRHSGVGLRTCRKCNKQFISLSALARHMLIHTKKKTHKCTQCKAKFNQESNLKRHMLTHSGIRAHKCTQCKVAFNQAGNLKIHMLTHSGIRAHKCTQCGKSFTASSNLTTHWRTHTGEKPYKCTQCGKSFTSSSNLTNHWRTHTGEKPYKCTICSRAFTLNSHLKKHMKTHSNETGNKT